MKYLVTMELIGTVPVASTQELVQWLEQMIIPTEEAMIKLEAERKILAGGDMSGRRGSAFILEAASNEELTRLLGSIPEWPLLKVDVTPLDSFEERLTEIRRDLDRLKAASK
jgi:muconolactone delta-isomerase